MLKWISGFFCFFGLLTLSQFSFSSYTISFFFFSFFIFFHSCLRFNNIHLYSSSYFVLVWKSDALKIAKKHVNLRRVNKNLHASETVASKAQNRKSTYAIWIIELYFVCRFLIKSSTVSVFFPCISSGRYQKSIVFFQTAINVLVCYCRLQRFTDFYYYIRFHMTRDL